MRARVETNLRSSEQKEAAMNSKRRVKREFPRTLIVA